LGSEWEESSHARRLVDRNDGAAFDGALTHAQHTYDVGSDRRGRRSCVQTCNTLGPAVPAAASKAEKSRSSVGPNRQPKRDHRLCPRPATPMRSAAERLWRSAARCSTAACVVRSHLAVMSNLTCAIFGVADRQALGLAVRRDQDSAILERGTDRDRVLAATATGRPGALDAPLASNAVGRSPMPRT
jgi:hypothetical protein